jgi:hypothetical protein
MRTMTAVARSPYLLLLVLSGCASDPTLSTPDPSASPQLVQARQVLSQQLTRSPFVADVVFQVDPGQPRVMDYTDPSTGVAQTVTLVTVLPATIQISYDPSPNAYTEPAWTISYTNYQDGHPYYWQRSGWSQADAQQIADALRVVVLDARQDGQQIFAGKYQKFLGLCQAAFGKPQPPLPEEARQHQVLAEDAVSRNDLDHAMDEYDKAISAAPCWAEGRRRDALLEGQTGWYLPAVQDMKKYLLLVPDAPDAQAMGDQILVWTDRMGGE